MTDLVRFDRRILARYPNPNGLSIDEIMNCFQHDYPENIGKKPNRTWEQNLDSKKACAWRGFYCAFSLLIICRLRFEMRYLGRIAL